MHWKATSVYVLPQDETLQAVIVAVVSTLIFRAIFLLSTDEFSCAIKAISR